MTKIRKAIALIMILLIAVSCVPMGAFAECAEEQDFVTEDTVPETTVESGVEVPPEEEPAFPEEQEAPPEITVADLVDDPPEETESGSEDTVIEDKDDGIIITDDPIPESPMEEPAEDRSTTEEPVSEVSGSDPEPESQEEIKSEAEETEPEIAVRGSMLLAAEPTRGSAYLQMIDMDQYSYSFGSSYPAPFKNQSRRRTCQF